MSEETGVNKKLLVAGLALLAGCLIGLVVLNRRTPCGCGEHQVDEIAKASAGLAQSNGKVMGTDEVETETVTDE